MKGLILKDMINLKKNFKVFGAVLLFYSVMAFSMDNPSYVGSMFTLIFAMLTLTTYSLDDLAKWEGYALTMPINRAHVVRGKYLIMLLLAAVSFLVSNVVLFFLNYIMEKQNRLEGMQISVIGTAIVILFYCIIIPFITKLGVEKSRFILIAIYGIPFLFGTIVYKKLRSRYPEPPIELVRIGKAFVANAHIIIPLFVLFALIISYKISVSIYRKKEF